MDGKPDCFTIFETKSHYPGEAFNISVVVVGEELGTVNGTVHAHFLPLQHSETQATLQHLQRVGHDSCNVLKYSVFSARDLEVLVFTAQDVIVSEYLNPASAISIV